MQMSQFHYLPLTPGFFSILVGVFFILLHPSHPSARCAAPI